MEKGIRTQEHLGRTGKGIVHMGQGSAFAVAMVGHSSARRVQPEETEQVSADSP
jgi:hypothetical protein